MKYIVIDTSIVLHILRNNSIAKAVMKDLATYDVQPTLVISSVTKGELKSFAKQRNWGADRTKDIDAFLENIIAVDVTFANEDLHLVYTSIDAFSKRKATDKTGKRLKGSARTMGKNDLWIAATAHLLDAPFMTTDGDFDHLDKLFIDVKKY